MSKQRLINTTAGLTLSKQETSTIRALFDKEPKSKEDCPLKEGEFITHTVRFFNNVTMDITVHGVKFDEKAPTNRPLASATLYKGNNPVAKSNTSGNFFGTWVLYHDGIAFTAIVEPTE